MKRTVFSVSGLIACGMFFVSGRADAGNDNRPNAAPVIKRYDEKIPAQLASGRVVFCPTGYVATGGGAAVASGAVLLSMPQSSARGAYNYPQDGDIPDGWYVNLRNDSPVADDAYWFVVCLPR